MLKFRTISDLVNVYVLPEVESRCQKGILDVSKLPIEVGQFLIIQGKLPDGKVENIIKFNEEVNLQHKVKLKRPVEKKEIGSIILLSDIYPDECFIVPPKHNGKDAAYFLCQSMLFDFFLCFDCEPNAPDFNEAEARNLIKYPVLDFINLKNFFQQVKPIEKLKSLASNNWPPAPGYHPHTFVFMHKNQTVALNDKEFFKIVSRSYSQEYWKNKIEFWEETNFFPNRIQYIKKAIDAHFQNDYISSIYVIVPQFEGIISNYIKECGERPDSDFEKSVIQLRKILLSRKILMFRKDLLDVIIDFLATGSFWKPTGRISDPTKIVNRHGIAHGVFTGFESEEVSLKYLILFDALWFLLLHDKMLRRALV